MTPRPPLDTFEAALLVRLRAVVDEPARPATAAWLRARRRHRWLTPAAVALVAAFAVVLGGRALWPTPAFAVTGTNTTRVVVKVARLEGADGLRRALAERGIPADVTYLPPGKKCAEGRYEEVEARGMVLGVSAERFQVTIPPYAVGPHDSFVLSAAVEPLANGARVVVSFGIARGPVAPCRVLDAG